MSTKYADCFEMVQNGGWFSYLFGVFSILPTWLFPRFYYSHLPFRQTCITSFGNLCCQLPDEAGLTVTGFVLFIRILIFGPAKTELIHSKFASCIILWKALVSMRNNYWVTVSMKRHWWSWWAIVFVPIWHHGFKWSIIRLCHRQWVCSIVLFVSVGSLVTFSNRS